MAEPKPQSPIRLHTLDISGHCHRVEMFLSMLELPYVLVPVDMFSGEHKKPPFVALNPLGQVPVIEDGDVTLADSNAILIYLESKYAPGQWLPRDPVGAAQVQRWLSMAAGLLAFGPAMARATLIFKRPDDTAPAIARAVRLLDLMELELKNSEFLVGSKPTLADVALYSYVARAPEGNVSLDPYPHVRAWLARIEALPRFVPMVTTKVGLSA
ncbi:MAG: glutathione S-transferase [Ramlibacter sp.]|nr:glutathione S-transferase [Ramlibacter sp.]